MEEVDIALTLQRHGKTTIYTEYDPTSPPPHPGKAQYTRFICLSDTHSHRFFVPDGDVLLHSGDLTHTGTNGQLEQAVAWLRELPHNIKIVIAGNHDLALDKDWYHRSWTYYHPIKQDPDAALEEFTCQATRDARLTYLQYESYEFKAKENGRKWKVFGSPGSPFFGDWAFNYQLGSEAEDIVSRIPLDTDILLTHGPPYRIMDRTNTGDEPGCPALLTRLEQVRPALHVFGHIHEGRGVEVKYWPRSSVDQDLPPDVTVCVNAANQPSGRSRRKGLGRWGGFGGIGVQPIIVDLWDPVDVELA